MLGFSAVAMCHIFSGDNEYRPSFLWNIHHKNPALLAMTCSPIEGHNQFLMDFSTDKISLSDRNKSLNKNKVSHKQLQCFPSTQYLAGSEALTMLAQWIFGGSLQEPHGVGSGLLQHFYWHKIPSSGALKSRAPLQRINTSQPLLISFQHWGSGLPQNAITKISHAALPICSIYQRI